ADESLAKYKALEFEVERLLRAVVSQDIMSIMQSNSVVDTMSIAKEADKQKMTLDIHNWSSTAHQELHKIIKAKIFPIVNQVDARVKNFEIQFLKEADKFV
ncbi:hypothetical protein Tco_0208113, partial [Tanacetum coccineum]